MRLRTLNKRLISKSHLLVVLSLLLFQSCGVRNEYNEFIQLPDDGWSFYDEIMFVPEHEDTLATVDVYVALRYNDSYPYADLWLEVQYDDAVSGVQTDTLNIPFSDNYGNRIGSGSGALYQREVPVRLGLRHYSKSPVVIKHIMRCDTLRQVDLIGLRMVGCSVDQK